jgi:acyl-coenzyme A synthetase/AMP-(fatty) acid ligase
VRDGKIFQPDTAGDDADGITRQTAFVVAPGVTADTQQSGLRQRIDRVFLPRPLVLVDALPRNSTGKLPRTALLALYQERLGRGRA